MNALLIEDERHSFCPIEIHLYIKNKNAHYQTYIVNIIHLAVLNCVKMSMSY